MFRPSLGQFGALRGFWACYLNDFAKTWSLGFRLDSGEKAKPTYQNLGGGGGVRKGYNWCIAQALAYLLVGVLGSSCQTQGGRGGILLLASFYLKDCVFGVK